MISEMKNFCLDKAATHKLFAYFEQILKNKEFILNNYNKSIVTDPLDKIERILKFNKLGPIIFITPEFGKFTMTGGLGRIIDNLTSQLVVIGEDIYAFAIYYNNLPGLETLDEKFEKVFTFNIQTGEEQEEVQIFFTLVNGVKLYFIKNENLWNKCYY